MTQDAKFKKAVRARMLHTGDSYTKARRDELASAATYVEAHYAFTPPWTIEFVDGRVRRELEPAGGEGPAFSWGYHGSGPNAASEALLLDATGDADHDLIMAFTDDNLAWFDEIGHKPFIITVTEVRAWRRENERRVRETRERESSDPASDDMAAAVIAYLEGPGRAGPWWQTRREAEGTPTI